MLADFSLNKKVILKSFHGTIVGNSDVRRDENYWRLVGTAGVIISDKAKIHSAFPKKGPQVLVRFESDIGLLGLISHNTEKNTLWIFVSDLES